MTDKGKPADTEPATPTQENPTPYTVLVADDEPALLRLMAFVMNKQGYTLLTAENGDDALRLAREHRPDLVVLDIMMPRLDGYEVAETLRADPAMDRMPIIILSARAQDADIDRGHAAGADAYITKPFEPDKFVEVVAAQLARHPNRLQEE